MQNRMEMCCIHLRLLSGSCVSFHSAPFLFLTSVHLHANSSSLLFFFFNLMRTHTQQESDRDGERTHRGNQAFSVRPFEKLTSLHTQCSQRDKLIFRIKRKYSKKIKDSTLLGLYLTTFGVYSSICARILKYMA